VGLIGDIGIGIEGIGIGDIPGIGGIEAGEDWLAKALWASWYISGQWRSKCGICTKWEQYWGQSARRVRIWSKAVYVCIGVVRCRCS
jgi:hypothetical protein